MENPDLSYASWTAEEVDNLNRFQNSSKWHPFTCGLWEMTRKTSKEDCPGQLVATISGWICPICKRYTQNWAHKFMVDFTEEVYNKQKEIYRHTFKQMGFNGGQLDEIC